MSANTVTIKGISLICPICGCKEFYLRKDLINTSDNNLLLDWEK